ncbi:MAG: FHA domain-containing protein [Isosphaeraceae bacterium]|nr:FHA domain-containing protein [Isosphaeraceae bacterium]
MMLQIWTDGDMMLRVRGQGRDTDRIVKIGRPFALVGQSPDSDICLSDPSVSERHAYLHLDPRGLYVVDLLTRTGTRIEGTGQGVGWVYPGQSFEVAGRQITLLRMRIDGAVCEPGPTDDDLLTETNQAALIGVTLEPHQGTDPPWELGSELVFLGWSSACGIQVKDKRAARAHCAIVRTAARVYLVDLCGRDVAVGNEAVSGVAPLQNGDVLTIGSTRFTVRAQLHGSNLPALRQPQPAPPAARYSEAEPAGTVLMPIPVDLVPAESQGALIAWMMGAIQSNQGEALRQQGEFQLALTDLLRQMQQDNARLLTAHLDRMEKIDRELTALRLEIQRRLDTPAPVPQVAHPNARPQPVSPQGPPLPPPSQASPLRIAKKAPDSAPNKASTTWLIERVSQLEDENRSAWRDLLSRLTSPPRRNP